MSNTQTAYLPDHSTKTIARHSVLNLLGQGAPLIAAIYAMPVLIHALGIDRFGVLTLAWVVIGYFSLFDFGIGRALTKAVADRLGNRQTGDIPALIWTALAIMLLLAIAGGVVGAWLTSWLVYAVLKIPPALRAETLSAFYLLAFSLPAVIVTAGLRGVLEAYQRFGLVNALRIPMGIFTFVGPLLVLPFTHSLVAVVSALVLGRVVGWLAHFYYCLQVVPAMRQGMALRREFLAPLFRFGGWLTVTNIVGPLMVYLDRFLIGALLSTAAVAFYTTPYEVVSKLLQIPLALTGVLFPAFASSFAAQSPRTFDLYIGGVKAVFLLLFPIILLIVTFSGEGLALWLDSDFAGNSSRVLQYLAVGLFLNSLAHIPYALIQAVGRPDVTAKLHMLELPLYLPLLWLLSVKMGIEGVAIAWGLRAAVDMLFLFIFAARLFPGAARRYFAMSAALATALAAFGIGAMPPDIALRGWVYLALLCAFALLSWKLLLSADERYWVERRFNHWRVRIKGVS
ncbi:MAG: flippase [Sulfuricellaceae bacterium]